MGLTDIEPHKVMNDGVILVVFLVFLALCMLARAIYDGLRK